MTFCRAVLEKISNKFIVARSSSHIPASFLSETPTPSANIFTVFSLEIVLLYTHFTFGAYYRAVFRNFCNKKTGAGLIIPAPVAILVFHIGST
jgi:hypothetical protein